ncbi:MAG: MFS transporter [Actinomycetes bacterium]
MGRLSSGPRRALDALLPPAAGRDFRWVWSAYATTNLGDGIALAAAPLLVASISREPLAVAAGVLFQRLPWIVFGVAAGAVVDRVDRRALIMRVNGLRALVLATLAATVALDLLTLPLLYGLLFLVGTAETFADNATSTLVAVTTPRDALGVANARLVGARVVTNELAGPPLGASLFAALPALPFVANAVGFLSGVLLVRRVRPSPPEPRPAGQRLVDDVREGLTWLRGHPAVRTLVLLIAVFNVTFGAAFSTWVLYALEVLGLSERGFGLLLTTSAAGGVLGAVLWRRIEARVSYATMLRVGLVVETCTHLGLALTDRPLVAGAVMFAFGIHAVVWGTLSNTIRQRAVPRALQGRVQSVYMLAVVGPLAAGAAIGGGLAQGFGLLAPFWFAFVGAGLTTAVVWRRIGLVAEAGA